MNTKEIEYKIKLAQLEKLQGTLVSKEHVKKQFILYNSILWNFIDMAIINIASTLATENDVQFDKCVNLLREKLYQIKETMGGTNIG